MQKIQKDYPSIICGAWEGYLTMARMGVRPEDSMERFINMHKEPFVRRLHEAGITVFIAHFFKGFGIELPEIKEELKLLKELVRICHSYGIRVGGYIGNGLVLETLKLEQPSCESWLTRDMRGNPIPYSWANAMRFFGCRNNPQYRAFIKKVCLKGVKEIGLDILHMDHVGIPSAACHCPCCRKDFKKYLEQTYPTDAAKRDLLGYANWKCIEPPLFDMEKGWGRPITRDALVIPWLRFQALRFSENMADIAAYMKQLNPKAEMAINCSGINSHPCGQLGKVDLDTMLSKNMAYFYDESGGPFTAVSDTGGIRSHLRSLKVAQSTGTRVLHYTGEMYPGKLHRLDEGNFHNWYDPRQRLAEALVMNRNCLGVVSCLVFDEFGPKDSHPVIIKYNRFLMEHQDLYAAWASSNKIAVWRSAKSMLCGGAEVHVPMCLVEQALMEKTIPFDMILDRGLNDLGNYKVVIATAAEVVSEEQERLLGRYVAAGNSLVLVGYTGAYNGSHQLMRKPRFSDLLGGPLPYDAKDIRWFKYGQGKVLFIPPALIKKDVAFWSSIYKDMSKPPIYHEKWKAPAALAKLKTWLQQLDKDCISLEVTGGGKVVCDIRYHPELKTEAIHILRYVAEKNKEAGVTLKVKLLGELQNKYRNYSFLAPGGMERKGKIARNVFSFKSPVFFGGVIVLNK